MPERKYLFFVKPLSASANEAIAKWFNDHGDSASTLECLQVVVNNNLVDGVYMVPSRFVAELKRSDHKQDVRVYVREGGGKTRPFFPYQKHSSPLARTRPAAMKVRKRLKSTHKK